jgi:hypothetical protein
MTKNSAVWGAENAFPCLPKKNVVCLGKESTNETLQCRFINDYFIKQRNEIESPIKEKLQAS